MKNVLGHSLICMLICASCLATAHAQDRYPSRPITFIVGFGAGGSSDMFARFIADYARKTRKATIVVENRVGLAGAIAIERVSKSQADGYTVGTGSISSLWVLPQLQKMNYEPVRDLEYLAKMFTQPLPLYVRADSPFKTYDDLLKYARANPGKLRWGTSGARGIAEILMESGFRHAGVETISVPYKAGVEANTALLGGHIEAVASTDFGPPPFAQNVWSYISLHSASIFEGSPPSTI